MNCGALILLISGLVIVACTPTETRQVVQAASDIRDIDRCAEFQAAKNVLHARLEDVTMPDLKRLDVINREGRILCTVDIDALTAELEAMAERLP